MVRTVMISSTVHDFRDARKLLKQVISQGGYNVIISEEGDIIVDSKRNIYENCFKAVEDSDIIITLIGSRYGSLFDPEKIYQLQDRNIDTLRNMEKSY